VATGSAIRSPSYIRTRVVQEDIMKVVSMLVVVLRALGGTIWAPVSSAQAPANGAGEWQGTWIYQNASLGAVRST
jgi:hypothetical protein